jgi:hypothetical protein
LYPHLTLRHFDRPLKSESQRPFPSQRILRFVLLVALRQKKATRSFQLESE